MKPSFAFADLIDESKDTFCFPLMIRFLMTSAGEQMVVATRPAANDMVTWVNRLSFIFKRVRQNCLKKS